MSGATDSYLRGFYRAGAAGAGLWVPVSVAPEGQLDVRMWVTTSGGVIVPARGDTQGRQSVVGREPVQSIQSLVGVGGGITTYAPSLDGLDFGEVAWSDVQIQYQMTLGGTSTWSVDWSVDRLIWRPVHETGGSAGALLNRSAVATEARDGSCCARYVRAWITVGALQGAGTYLALSARVRT